jgi:hypothetical protein
MCILSRTAKGDHRTTFDDHARSQNRAEDMLRQQKVGFSRKIFQIFLEKSEFLVIDETTKPCLTEAIRFSFQFEQVFILKVTKL